MKHYKIKDTKLKLTDASPLLLAMPFIGTVLSCTGVIGMLASHDAVGFDFISGLFLAIISTGIIVITWASIKKTFKSIIPLEEITQLKQSSVNSSGFYLLLNNGRQRDLVQIKEPISAIKLLTLLRQENPSITANFTEKEVTTR